MEKEFISNFNIVLLKYYGMCFRIDVLDVGDDTFYLVSVRADNRRDKQTFVFHDFDIAKEQFIKLIHDFPKGNIFFIK